MSVLHESGEGTKDDCMRFAMVFEGRKCEKKLQQQKNKSRRVIVLRQQNERFYRKSMFYVGQTEEGRVTVLNNKFL